MATYYFRNAGVNWGDAANWSLTDGGGATGAVPTTADDAYFTSNSGNCTINASARVCKTLIFAGVGAGDYTGTVTMTFGITVYGNVVLSGTMGNFASTGNLTLNASASYDSNGKTFPNTLILVGGTTTLSENATVGGLSTTSGTSVLNSNNLYITGSLTITNALLGTTALHLTGTGTWSGNTNFANDLTINTAGTITLSGTVRYGDGSRVGTLTYLAGTLVTTGSTLRVFQQLKSNGVNWGAIFLVGSGAILTLLDDAYCTNITTDSGVSTVNGFNLYITGGISNTGGGIYGTTVFNLTGTGTWSGNTIFQNTLTINTSGTITLSGTIQYGLSGRTLTYTAGTIAPGTSTFQTAAGLTYSIASPGSFTLWNWSPATGTHTINTGTITVNNNMTLGGNTTFAGTGGWTANDLTDSTINRVIQLQSNATSVYTITGNLSLTGTNAAPIVVQSSDAVNTAKLTLNQGANQTVQFVRATRIDSSAGQTVWDTIGTISNPLVGSINWNSGARPAPFNSIRMG